VRKIVKKETDKQRVAFRLMKDDDPRSRIVAEGRRKILAGDADHEQHTRADAGAHKGSGRAQAEQEIIRVR
jgi:hypothetical protein